jgi:deoxyribodipyrimidine photo-lyase
MRSVELVWFKRDLRIHDHAPLSTAAASSMQRGSCVLPIYVIEDDYWQQADVSVRQYDFLRESLNDLRTALAQLGQPLQLFQGEVVTILSQLRRKHHIQSLHSHEETGNGWTFARDRSVKTWCREHSIAWHQYRQFGVVRGLRERRQWAMQWEALMTAPVIQAPGSLAYFTLANQDGCLESVPAFPGKTEHGPIGGGSIARDLDHYYAQGGRAHARQLLHSFFTQRGREYSSKMSSPNTAERACSRLSAHLSLGTISLREVSQMARKHKERAMASATASPWPRAINSFVARLHWHCHFIQKLESEPAIEFHNINIGYDGLRDNKNDARLVAAWARGETGWPFVDACMRMLNATGWINFRMRAMLMSVSSYQLWQHWREPGLHLARQFVDYEPGIHWSQVQMQSGVTGINIPRIYNPIKQSQDQDPGGDFIRRWIPQLDNVPKEFIHQPWLLPLSAQQRFGVIIGQDYPPPICDHIQAAREAKAKLTSWRAKSQMQELNAAVLRKHGSKKRTVKRPKRQVSPQIDLFGSHRDAGSK